jgi:release factor glutamine methyltransferase
MTQPAAQKSWTILELLRWTTEHFAKQGIESARLDAECLLAHALGVDRLRLYVEFDKPLAPAERAGFRELVRRRAEQRVPVAQLTGRKEFWSLPLAVTPDVLAPRPETETLIETALELAPERDAELRILDVGTGSGAVALALASERPKALVTATDISPAALAVARANAERLELSGRVRFLEGSLFQPVAGERFDLVVSNPPYLSNAAGARRAPELAHEPPEALFAAEQGFAVLRALAQGVLASLLPGGGAAFEVSPEQGERVAGWCREAGLLDVTLRRDLGRRVRVVSGKRSAQRAEGERSSQRLAAGERS